MKTYWNQFILLTVFFQKKTLASFWFARVFYLDDLNIHRTVLFTARVPCLKNAVPALQCNKELDQEYDRQHIGQYRYLLGLTGQALNDGITDQCKTNAMTDRPRNGHCEQHNANGSHLRNILKVDLPQVTQHQNADIDQRRGSCSGRNNGGNRCNKDAQEEPANEIKVQQTADNSSHSRSPGAAPVLKPQARP